MKIIYNSIDFSNHNFNDIPVTETEYEEIKNTSFQRFNSSWRKKDNDDYDQILSTFEKKLKNHTKIMFISSIAIAILSFFTDGFKIEWISDVLGLICFILLLRGFLFLSTNFSAIEKARKSAEKQKQIRINQRLKLHSLILESTNFEAFNSKLISFDTKQ